MLARLSLLTLAMLAVAGVANAQANKSQQIGQTMSASGHRHKVAIVDEYGFRYDNMGNRLDAAGHVIAPPHTLPGARVIQN